MIAFCLNCDGETYGQDENSDKWLSMSAKEHADNRKHRVILGEFL